jgi:hypothetical protein
MTSGSVVRPLGATRVEGFIGAVVEPLDPFLRIGAYDTFVIIPSRSDNPTATGRRANAR